MRNLKIENAILVLISLILFSSVNTSRHGSQEVQEDVGEYLDKLGRSLRKTLSNPGAGCDTLLRDLFDYYNHLQEIHDNITSGDPLVAKEGYDLVQELLEGGGPPHLKIVVDFDELLFKVFKNDRDVQAIHKVLKDNRETWEKVKALYEKHAQI